MRNHAWTRDSQQTTAFEHARVRGGNTRFSGHIICMERCIAKLLRLRRKLVYSYFGLVVSWHNLLYSRYCIFQYHYHHFVFHPNGQNGRFRTNNQKSLEIEHIFVPSQYLVGAGNHICRTPNALKTS